MGGEIDIEVLEEDTKVLVVFTEVLVVLFGGFSIDTKVLVVLFGGFSTLLVLFLELISEAEKIVSKGF